MASASKAKKLVVCGGNGFLGSRICKAASARGWRVTSLSRSGTPDWSSVTSSSSTPTWAQSVSWEKANVFDPNTYSNLLHGADAVVHSMGILIEANYKPIARGKESIFSALLGVTGFRRGQRTSPLDRRPLKGGSSTAEYDDQLTYELMNRDSAITLARESYRKNIPVFAFISAAAGAPFLPSRYISTKREAESTIAAEFHSMRSIFIRPPFLYDSSRVISIPLASLIWLGAIPNMALGGALTPLLGAGVIKPLKADAAASAVVESIEQKSVKGPVELDEIEGLASLAWRKGML